MRAAVEPLQCEGGSGSCSGARQCRRGFARRICFNTQKICEETGLQQAVADVEELAELHGVAHGLVVEHGQAVDHADHARARRNRQLDRLLQLREDVRHVLDDGHDVVLEARAVREVRDDALGERDAHLRE